MFAMLCKKNLIMRYTKPGYLFKVYVESYLNSYLKNITYLNAITRQKQTLRSLANKTYLMTLLLQMLPNVIHAKVLLI